MGIQVRVDEQLVRARRQVGQLNKQRNAKLNRIIDLEEQYWDPEKKKQYTEAQLHTMFVQKKQLRHEAAILRSSILAIMKEIKHRMVRDQVFATIEGEVTDHALVRWLERKHGLDVKQIKADMYRAMCTAAHRDDKVITGKGGGCLQVEDGEDYYVIDPVFGHMVTFFRKGDPEEDWMEVEEEEVAK